MLIPSHRHRPNDLALWPELEEADLLHAERLRRSGKIDRSMDAIRQFFNIGPAYVGVSWGKDSVAVAHLVARINPTVHVIHLHCTNRNPDNDAVRNTFLARLPLSYQEVAVDYGDLHARNLPHQRLDRETDARWYAAIRTSDKPYDGRHILGIRADESSGRRLRCRIWRENSPHGCAPLAWWTAEDVFAYLAAEELPVHPAYAMLGGGRWARERLRVAEIGDTHGTGSGRAEWEAEYYGDILRRLQVKPVGV